jgi:pimeloyl-ACP methyl ester carboxylesterase
VVEAMRAVGVRQGEPVLLVGHSQGGLIAATVAADPAVRREFAVTQVLTTGAPVASIPIPDDVHVLSIEHSDDLVPRLDGSANRDRPNWVTVSARAPIESLRSAQERSEPLVAHRLELYQRTAARIDSSIDPSIVNWRQGLSPFLYGPRSSGGAAWDVEVSRVGTS